LQAGCRGKQAEDDGAVCDGIYGGYVDIG
jgi:hypothetical protein